jgi:hypothetical protein
MNDPPAIAFSSCRWLIVVIWLHSPANEVRLMASVVVVRPVVAAPVAVAAAALAAAALAAAAAIT